MVPHIHLLMILCNKKDSNRQYGDFHIDVIQNGGLFAG